jgi:hypothetical protein
MRNAIVFSLVLLLVTLLRSQHQITVPMRTTDYGVYYVPAVVNGDSLEFTFDTGAYAVMIPRTVADSMIARDALLPEDVIGPSCGTVANGSLLYGIKVNIRSFIFGGVEFKDVEADITNSNKFLLGQTLLQRFKSYRIDNTNHTLVAELSPTYEEGCYEGNCENGYGKYRLENGDHYWGYFVNGEFEGTGIVGYADGGGYLGFWKKSLMHGFGKCALRDGSILEGSWFFGERHGKFRWEKQNGEVEFLTYNYGEIINE